MQEESQREKSNEEGSYGHGVTRPWTCHIWWKVKKFLHVPYFFRGPNGTLRDTFFFFLQYIKTKGAREIRDPVCQTLTDFYLFPYKVSERGHRKNSWVNTKTLPPPPFFFSCLTERPTMVGGDFDVMLLLCVALRCCSNVAKGNARLAGRQRIDLDISQKGADCNARPER